MKIRILLGLIIAATSILCYSCAKPEIDTLSQNTNAGGGSDVSQSETDSSGAIVYALPSDIKSDNDRRVTETYGSGDYSFKIDATILVPDSEIQTGTLDIKEVDVSLIEQYLCGGELLHAAETQDSSIQYVSDGNEVDNDLDYDIGLMLSGDGTGIFTNYKIDTYFTGDELKFIMPEEQAAEQKAFVESMEQQVQEIFNSLQLEAEVSHSWLQVGDANNNCVVFVNAYLNGFPLVLKEYGTYVQSNLTIAEQGVNGLFFDGLYKIKNATTASVMSLNEVLEIIKRDVESKNINGFRETIESIELAYMINRSDVGLEFYPVWCFSGRHSSISGLMPFLCINAQTGGVELMSGY